MKTLLLRNWLSMVLSFMGAFSPVQFHKEALPKMIPAQALVAQAVRPVKQAIQITHKTHKTAHLNIGARTYTYVFAGKASFNGMPSANAQVNVRASSENGIFTRQTRTDADGIYRVSMTVTGKFDEMISCEISAITSDLLQKASVEGRQIPLHDSRVTLDPPLSFA